MTKVNLAMEVKLAVGTFARFICIGFRGGLDFHAGRFPEIKTGDRPDISRESSSNWFDSPSFVGRMLGRSYR